MAEQSFWQRLIAAINAEYERRIRRASLIGHDGAGHPEHDDHSTSAHMSGFQEPHSADGEEFEEAEIVNVPKGTPLSRRAHADPPSDAPAPPL